MWLDILFFIVLISAFYSGYRKGILQMLVSVVGVIIAGIFALKASYIVGAYLGDSTQLNPLLIPILAIILTFLIAFYIIKFSASFLESLFKKIQINFANQFFGGVLSAIFNVLLLGVFLKFLVNAMIIPPSQYNASQTAPALIPASSFALQKLKDAVPFLKQQKEKLEQKIDEGLDKTK